MGKKILERVMTPEPNTIWEVAKVASIAVPGTIAIMGAGWAVMLVAMQLCKLLMGLP